MLFETGTTKRVIFVYLLFENNRCFGVWPKPNYVNFLEGVLLCPKLISAGFFSVVFI